MITLSINTLQVSFYQSLNVDLPRVRVNVGSVDYVATGSVVGRGTLYEPFHLWTFNALVDEEQMQLLKAIYALHDYQRRHFQDANVAIVDQSQLYEEPTPRTRAIVPGTSEILLPASAPICTLYYAVFAGWFNQEPRFAKPYKLGSLYSCQFTMQETDRVAAG